MVLKTSHWSLTYLSRVAWWHWMSLGGAGCSRWRWKVSGGSGCSWWDSIRLLLIDSYFPPWTLFTFRSRPRGNDLLASARATSLTRRRAGNFADARHGNGPCHLYATSLTRERAGNFTDARHGNGPCHLYVFPLIQRLHLYFSLIRRQGAAAHFRFTRSAARRNDSLLTCMRARGQLYVSAGTRARGQPYTGTRSSNFACSIELRQLLPAPMRREGLGVPTI
jgi:hypothetical protein